MPAEAALEASAFGGPAVSGIVAASGTAGAADRSLRLHAGAASSRHANPHGTIVLLPTVIVSTSTESCR
jgi:hypothetical protein